jgi:hypothetical protein
MQPSNLVPVDTTSFQIELVIYGYKEFDSTQIFHSYQAVKNYANFVLKSRNRNQMVFDLIPKITFSKLYESLVFVRHPRIKKLQLKAVPKKHPKREISHY